MDVQEYISSGNLEQYVLGELSSQERLEVEHYASLYPAIQEELNAIDAALFEVANANAIKPILSEDAILDFLDTDDIQEDSIE